MQQFAKLIEKIEQTKSTKEKVQWMQRYFESAPSDDAAWALYFLLGNKLKRLIGPTKLFEWSHEALPLLPEWLILESYSAVGDLAETISLLVAQQNQTLREESPLSLSEWINNKILPLQNQDKEYQKQQIIQFWNELPPQSIFVLNKILTGSLRIGASHLLTIEGLSKAINVPKETLSHRLMGLWQPSSEFFNSLKNKEHPHIPNLNPYPFYLASPLQETLDSLGHPNQWTAEWKWDGMRAQCVKRDGQIAIWSRGNELITHQFPEIVEALKTIKDGTVLDGEILAYKKNAPLPFAELQKRLGRKKVSSAMIESAPIIFMIYDILEYEYEDIRKKPYIERRELFETWHEKNGRLNVSPLIVFKSWDEIKSKRLEASSNNTEGVMLKKKDSPYLIGRRKGNWWKYKIDPKTIDAILIYAQPGNGWRANLYTDYTFGVWHEQELVPIAKAYSGLSMDEIYQLDKWIRKNTLEKFGPVRRVKPELVFEIAFEGIQKSSRHKAGIAFRFPRILRWRHDKPIQECDTLDNIKKEFMNEPMGDPS